jgi:hypothetical protein
MREFCFLCRAEAPGHGDDVWSARHCMVTACGDLCQKPECIVAVQCSSPAVRGGNERRSWCPRHCMVTACGDLCQKPECIVAVQSSSPAANVARRGAGARKGLASYRRPRGRSALFE